MPQVTNHTKPFIVDKNLGAALDIDNAQLTETTSDGTPVVEPTQEQKYLFDMRGWLLVPGVLSGDELAEMQEFGYKLRHEPDSIPEHERSPLGGADATACRSSECHRLSQRVSCTSCIIQPRLLRFPDGIV